MIRFNTCFLGIALILNSVGSNAVGQQEKGSDVKVVGFSVAIKKDGAEYGESYILDAVPEPKFIC
ncbi:MAG: hypothetical protein R3C03_02365 [Pirellulaceae bacterium]